MWIIDLLLSFPAMLLSILIVAVLGASLDNAIIAVGISNIPLFARLARSSALVVTQQDYVQAARALGQRDSENYGIPRIDELSCAYCSTGNDTYCCCHADNCGVELSRSGSRISAAGMGRDAE